MNKQRLTILIVAAIGAFSTFLPWANILLLGSVSGLGLNQEGSIFYFSIVIILCLIGNKKNRIAGKMMYAVIIFSILAGLTGMYTLYNINQHSYISGDISSNDSFPPGATPAIGLYLVLLAGFAIPFIAFLVKDKVESITE